MTGDLTPLRGGIRRLAAGVLAAAALAVPAGCGEKEEPDLSTVPVTTETTATTPTTTTPTTPAPPPTTTTP